MPMGMPEWDRTPESAQKINLAFLQHRAQVGAGREIPIAAEALGELVAEIAQLRAALAAATQRAEAEAQLATDRGEAIAAANARADGLQTRLAAEKQENARMRMYIEELCRRLKRTQVLDAADAAKVRAQAAGLWGKPEVQP